MESLLQTQNHWLAIVNIMPLLAIFAKHPKFLIVTKFSIFSIHYFFAEGKKVKGMVRNDVFWGWGR